MDKYGTAEQDLLEGLRNEEHKLMLEMMSSSRNQYQPEKTASLFQGDIDRRLQEVRNKITELDLKLKTQ